jgi:hypothetical protein
MFDLKRRQFIMLLGGGAAVAWPVGARAQQPHRIWRIGFIAGASRPASLEVSQFGGFQQGMREHEAMSRAKISSWSGALRMRNRSAIPNLPPSSCD